MDQVMTLTETTCYHCGEKTTEDLVVFDGKDFCCPGCKLVFEILQENNLCQYYDLATDPGIKVTATDQGDKYEFLENKEIRDALIDLSEGGVTRVKFFIPQIHCSSCIWLLESLPKLHNGVVRSSIDFVRKTLTISYREENLSLRGLVELLATIGYAPSLTMDRSGQVPVQKVDRSLYYKIGIAGFCFGNIMLLSFPEYFSGGVEELQLKRLFSYLQLGLALPVFFYSASDYFNGALRGLKGRTMNIDVPISIGVLTLFLRSAFEIITGTGAGYMDSLAGLIFFLLIGKWYQAYSYQALSFDRDHRSYFPMAVRRIVNGIEKSIPIARVEKGDLLLIRNNELVPADAILRKGVGNIDHSFITGEPVPITKMPGDMIHAGGKQVGASIEVEVERPIANSYLSELWSQDVFNSAQKVPMATMVDRLSKYFTFGILAISSLTLFIWYFLDASLMWSTFTAVLIVACPCALALTVPFSYGHAMRILGRHGLFMKNANVTGAFADLDVVVFDKTGTLSEMGAFNVEFVGEALSEGERALVRSAVRHSTHPFSTAIYDHLNEDAVVEVDRSEEIPGEGIRVVTKGVEIRIGSQRLAGGNTSEERDIGPHVCCTIAGEFRGYFLVREHMRSGVVEMVEELKKHMEVYLISGDTEPDLGVLGNVFPKAHMFFGQKPIDKLELIKGLQEQGHKVLMIGDGLNDAGALEQAEVGMAIANDHSSFTPASDAILSASALLDLPRLFSFGRNMKNVVVASLVISLLYNLVGLSFAVQGQLTPLFAAILMPLSSVTVVAFIALAVGWRAKQMGLLNFEMQEENTLNMPKAFNYSVQ